jgi:ferredoxin
VALDAALADRTDHARGSIYTLAAAERRGLIDLRHPYELVGDPIEADREFEKATRDMNDRVPAFAQRWGRHLLTARPRLVSEAACTRCGECEAICGAHAITMRPTPVYDDEACVRCYACTEVCPTQAIQEVSPRTLRALGKLRRP